MTSTAVLASNSATPVAHRSPGGIAGQLLLVRHGFTRGDNTWTQRILPKYFQPVLDDFADRYPELRRAIRHWHTGSAPPNLDNVRAIVFLLADPLRERFPDCYREAMQVAEQARRRGVRLVNPPDVLSNSRKTIQSALWRAAGIPTPTQYGFTNRAELLAAGEECAFPAVIRADLLHSQRGIHWIESRDALRRLTPEQISFPGSIGPFVDTREGYRRTAPGTPWAELYHKKRVFVFGTHVRPNHVFFGTSPLVSAKSCTFGHYRSLSPIRRYRANRRCGEHIALDLAYAGASPEQPALFIQAAAILGLEFVAFDYSTFADGRVVLWEANPHFSLHQWPIEILPWQRHLRERIQGQHDAMRMFWLDLLRAE